MMMTDTGDDPIAARAHTFHALLSALTHALGTFNTSDDEGAALRTSFRCMTDGLRAQRSFLARIDADRRVGEVLACEGLSPLQLEGLRSGTSSPGVSASLIRAALQSGRACVIEDGRLASRRGEATGTLATGDYSVACAPIHDPYTRAPLAVLYVQTSSLTEPLQRDLLPHIEAYTLALAHGWHVWQRTRHVLGNTAVRPSAGVVEIVGHSKAIAALRDHVQRILVPAMCAAWPDPILVLGDTGTGKEVLARYLHACSPRAQAPFVALNCATFAGDVLQSTLFGHAKGSFTGAVGAWEGMFAAADKGVLFLDELGDMPLESQGLLLRAIESRSVRALGARDERPLNVQFVCATNKNVEAEVKARRFREDLFHRLKALTVRLPPLCERPDDVHPLLSHFVAHHERRLGKRTGGLARRVLRLLVRYSWPGNVRELMNVASVLVLHTPPGRPIDDSVLADAAPEVFEEARRAGRQPARPVNVDRIDGTLAEARSAFQRAYVHKAGRDLGWNKTLMAQRLGLNRSALHRLLRRHDLKEDRGDE